MNKKTTSTEEPLFDEHIKTLLYTKNDKLYVSNMFDPKFIPFFKDLIPDHKEIVYFEHTRPVCPNCGVKMNSNGSKKSKPNMHDNICKKQYKCPKCNKSIITSIEDYIPKNSNYSYDIAEKGLNYDTITYASYEAKSEIINFENNVKNTTTNGLSS